MRILFLGDICGRCGREAVFDFLPGLKNEYKIDLTVANGENSSGGLGMNKKSYDELRRAGVDFFTMGNHTFAKEEVNALFDRNEDVIRPANMPEGTKGEGMAVFSVGGVKVALINLLGRVFMDENQSPFETADQLVKKAAEKTPVILVDFHAEATSEKQALGYHLDGRVSAVVGTHTHVQTADERILPQKTAYITDVGMCGARNSVLGMDITASLKRFLSPEGRGAFKSAKGDYMLCGVVIDIDGQSGKAGEIIRLCRF